LVTIGKRNKNTDRYPKEGNKPKKKKRKKKGGASILVTMVSLPAWKPPHENASGYELVGGTSDPIPDVGPKVLQRRRPLMIIMSAFVACMVICLTLKFADANLSLVATLGGLRPGSEKPAGSAPGAENGLCECSTPNPPQYFQTTPELWAGPTATGKAAFLAQTVAFDPTRTYVPNAPLQTAIPIQGMGQQNESIFNMMG
jgi:hypothetical protein